VTSGPSQDGQDRLGLGPATASGSGEYASSLNLNSQKVRDEIMSFGADARHKFHARTFALRACTYGTVP
jgi:hypothetical protein